MEQADLVVEESISLGELMQAQKSFIDFQLPATLCYVTLAVVMVLSKAVLVERIDQMLVSESRLVLPDRTNRTNWKLTNEKGERIQLQEWNALQHAGTTIMVSFDQDFARGELQPVPWQASRIVSASGGVFKLSQHCSSPSFPDNLLKIPPSQHPTIYLRVHRRSNRGKTFLFSYSEVIVLPTDSLNLSTLAKILLPISGPPFRFRVPADRRSGQAEEVYVYVEAEKKISELRTGINILQLDILIG